MERIVWNYWESPPHQRTLPPHIALCQATLRKHLSGCDHRMVTGENLREYLPDIHPNIDQITRADQPGVRNLAIKAGIVRVFLLQKFGGLWIDMDAIVYRDLLPVLEKLDDYECVGMRQTSTRRQIVNNFFGSVPGGPIITAYAAMVREVLSQRTVYEWNEIGSDMLTPIVDGNLSSVYLFDEKLICPLHAGKQPLYMDDATNADDLVTDETLTFMLFHRIFGGAHQKVGVGLAEHSVDELYYSKMLIGKLVRRALTEEEFTMLRPTIDRL